MQIQSNLASTIAMAFDECPPHPATREYVQKSVDQNDAVAAHVVRQRWQRLNALAGYD